MLHVIPYTELKEATLGNRIMIDTSTTCIRVPGGFIYERITYAVGVREKSVSTYGVFIPIADWT